MSHRNENRLGYKKTTVGWIPSEWTSIALGEIGVMRSGGTPSKEIASFWKGNIPWFTAKDLKSFRLKTSQDTISEEGLLKGSRLAPAGSILILVPGMTLFRDLPVGVLDVPAGFNQDIKVIEPLKGFDPLFAGYAITARKEILKRLVEHAGHGTGRIDTGLLQGCLFPFPPYKEQKKIAEILSTWDNAIEQLRKLINAKRRLKKALMQQLLTGKTKLRGFEEDSWEIGSLGNLISPISRPVPKPDRTYLSIGLRSHCKGTFHKIIDEPEKIMMDTLYRVEPEDLIVSITFAWEGAIAFVAEEDSGGLVSHRFPTFRLKTKSAVLEFVRNLILTERFIWDLGLISPGGAGRNRVMNKKDFLKLKVYVPSIQNQIKIGQVLSTADSESISSKKNLKPWKNKNAA